MTFLVDLTSSYLLLLLCFQQTFIKKFNTITCCALTAIGWLCASVLAVPPAFIASDLPVARTFCCLSWTSQEEIDKIYLNGLFFISFSGPIVLIVISYVYQRRNGDSKYPSKEICLSISSLLRISLAKIIFSVFYSNLSIMKIFSMGSYIPDNVSIFGISHLQCFCSTNTFK